MDGERVEEYLQPSKELCICQALASLLDQLPYSAALGHPSRDSYPLAAPLSLSLRLPELLSAAAALNEGSGGAEEEVCRVAVPLHSSKEASPDGEKQQLSVSFETVPYMKQQSPSVHTGRSVQWLAVPVPAPHLSQVVLFPVPTGIRCKTECSHGASAEE